MVEVLVWDWPYLPPKDSEADRPSVLDCRERRPRERARKGEEPANRESCSTPVAYRAVWKQ